MMGISWQENVPAVGNTFSCQEVWGRSYGPMYVLSSIKRLLGMTTMPSRTL